MGFDPHVVDQLVALVREQFPDWAGFDHQGFRREERDYKVAAVEKAIGADGLLNEPALREDLDGRAFNSFIERFDKLGHATNLLYQSVPMSGDLSALYHAREKRPEVLEAYCHALFDLLWGEGTSPERLGRYVDFVKANDLPNKWTLPTYFLFLTHPDEDMFVKPRTMARVAKHLDVGWNTKGAPTGEEYGRILAWSRELRTALEPLGAEDMIDVQSLLWTAGWQLGQPAPSQPEPPHVARYWKVAPREGAALWSDWLEHAHITVGWEELGDLSELTPDEWPAHRDRICSEYGWTTASADQCWRFANDIGPGDRIVANRGTKGIVGIGTVVGEYYYVPNERESHRMPVRWDDVRPRTLPQPNSGWRRTLIELKREEFDSLLALLPEGGEVLGPPFDKLFADRAEGEAALDLMADVMAALGVTANDDSRFAVTYSTTTRRLTLDYGPWCMMRCWPVEQPERLQLALLEHSGVLDSLPVDFRFKEAAENRPVVLRTMAPAALNDEIRRASFDTAREASALFGHRRSSNWRRYHVEEVGAALLDPTKRDSLLAHGLSAELPEPDEPVSTYDPVDHPAFSQEARDLLVAMDAEPTKAFYAEHKEGLTEHVQEPVRAFLKRIAARVSPQLRDSLEVEKRLFGVFNKNDYGRGGAWPFYWGAFYPLGGTKTRDCQLFVTLSADGFAYGFSIGNYASDNHKRFKKNIHENRQALAAALGDTINAPEFHFGDANRSEGDKGVSGPPDLDLDGWFALIESSGPQVHVDVFWDELLATEMPTLEARVTNAFNRLFPLVLLGTLDDPLPAIDEYLSSATEDHDEEDANPAYTLDDLAAETSLPRENLERWLRAIERKGQAILYGPPGTGKTYVAERLAKHLVAGGTGISELVQFHPAYAYEDFMQGIRPKARDGGGLDYPVVDGRFKQFCQQARGRKGLSVLIIDEVNRANLARVFGELMYLLEYRDKSIPLASGGTFSIPGNVRIIGTMNTADRSIALVDHALRRRFAFLPLYPDYQMLTDFHEKAGMDFDPSKLIAVLKELNHKIGDHHYEVGTSFFLRADIADQLPDVWAMEIEPYLEEYFFDQQATVEAYRWTEVAKKLDLG